MHMRDPERPGNKTEPTLSQPSQLHLPTGPRAQLRDRCLSQNAGVYVILERFPRRP